MSKAYVKCLQCEWEGEATYYAEHGDPPVCGCCESGNITALPLLRESFVAVIKRPAAVVEHPMRGLVEVTVTARHENDYNTAQEWLDQELPTYPADHYGMVEKRHHKRP